MPDILELLLLVANHRTNGFDVICRNGDLGTGKCVAYVKILSFLVITEPQSPVELFDVLVAAFCNLMDGRIWMQWLVFELKVERYCIIIADVDCEKIWLALSKGTCSTINGELVRLIAEQADDNLLASTRDKNATKRIGDIRCALYNKPRPDDCMPPIQLRSSKDLKPVLSSRE